MATLNDWIIILSQSSTVWQNLLVYTVVYRFNETLITLRYDLIRIFPEYV